MAVLSLLLLLLLFAFSLSLSLLFLFLIVRPRSVSVPIKQRHVFITGGSSGIGQVLAKQAALQGARVSILARSIEKLEEAKQLIRLSTGINVDVYSADVTDYKAVEKAVEMAGPMCWCAELPGMRKSKDRQPASIAIMPSQAGQLLLRIGSIRDMKVVVKADKNIFGLHHASHGVEYLNCYHVSLIFPPDTETPGFVEENKRRTQLTSVIAASSVAMKPGDFEWHKIWQFYCALQLRGILAVHCNCWSISSKINFDGIY
ncbi:hypothetical protein LguiA_001643 [Lonicera macranthoides]